MITTTTPTFCRWLKVAILATGIVSGLTRLASADVPISLGAGYIHNHTGGQLPAYTSLSNTGVGGLLLFVAANPTTNTFNNAITAGNYVAGGDTILASFGFNNFGGNATNQTTENTVTLTTATLNTVNPGTTLIELCWFPDITLAQYGSGTKPAANSYFGAYNPSFYSSNASLSTDGGNAWVVPPTTSRNYTLNFFTTDNTEVTGTQSPSEGNANFLVGAATGVPEPSLGVLSGLGLAIVVGVARRWRNPRASA